MGFFDFFNITVRLLKVKLVDVLINKFEILQIRGNIEPAFLNLIPHTVFVFDVVNRKMICPKYYSETLNEYIGRIYQMSS